MKSLREGTGEQRGGQKGHKGGPCDRSRILTTLSIIARRPARAVRALGRTRVSAIPPVRCLICPIRNRSSSPNIVRMIANAPPVARRRERRFRTGSRCARSSMASRIAAFVVYLSRHQLLPEDRLAELMADLFGVKLAAATIARMSRTCAERLRGFVNGPRNLPTFGRAKFPSWRGW